MLGIWMDIRLRTAQGVPLSRIAADLGIDRKTARKHRDAESDPEAVSIVRRRASRFAVHEAYITKQLKDGVRISQIARELACRSKTHIPYTSFWDYASRLAASSPPREDPCCETASAEDDPTLR
jgi:hypothetical protein